MSVQSITYNTTTLTYDVVLPTLPVEEEVERTLTIITPGEEFTSWTNGVTFNENSTSVEDTLTVPAGVNTFSTANPIALNTFKLVIDDVVADDIGTSNEVSSITFLDDTFTVTLTQALDKAKSFEFSISSNPKGIDILSLESSEYVVLTQSDPSNIFQARGRPSPTDTYILVPAGTAEFKINVYYPILNVERDITLNVAGEESTDTVPAFASADIQATLQTTNAGSGSTESVSIAFDYSDHFNRAITALEFANNNSQTLLNKLTAVTESLQEIANSVNEQTLQLRTGVPIMDVYAPLSYSSLVKLYDDEGTNVTGLIARTKSVLGET